MPINLSEIKSKGFCAAPWVNIHISMEGKIKPCCNGKPFGMIQDNDWSYVNGTNERLNVLKRELLTLETVDYCKGCTEKPWYDEFVSGDLMVKDANDFVLKSIDARWGTTCQLSCTYCDAGNSSTWAQLESKYKKEIPIIAREYKNQIETLFQFIENNKTMLTRVSLVGGEPLLLKENIRLLDLLPENVAIEIITNLNVDLESNQVYQRLIKRDNVRWSVSMENVGKRFEFVRRGANWDRQVKNLRLVEKNLTEKSSIYMHSQFCVYNALNLLENYIFAGTFDRLQISWSLAMSSPAVLNFFSFPKHFKDQAGFDINHILDSNRWSWAETGLLRILDRLSQSNETPNIVNDCIQFHNTQERRYFNNQFDFLKLWPQYQI